jgi:hypothetical protein
LDGSAAFKVFGDLLFFLVQKKWSRRRGLGEAVQKKRRGAGLDTNSPLAYSLWFENLGKIWGYPAAKSRRP